ncbi:tetratricopeptide repeat protein [Actinokineospora spheciospongiae]|uniref:tetratricopeptide repeat protein n=1 Tax=Actinokineospora spheciospongiae TaxID=909613 RepID=UPI000D718ECD|nr:tetratricopeptide repeat protein [Actinokineospora spheciospongiae]PWW55518.1 hypothetical protein DFQ13_112172 [Actinokineospora spheciospongiae]
MLRTWQDVIAKWRLLPDGDGGSGAGGADSADGVDGDAPRSATDDPGPQAFRRGRSALLSGRLDDALAEFGRAAGTRAHPHDHVGLGDVALARGQVRSAVVSYRTALELAPGDRLALLGLSQARVASGDAEAAAAELEQAFGTEADPVLRYYLASTWCSAADQVRGRTGDGGDVLAFTDERQLAVCEDAAHRIVELDVADEELRRAAQRLLSEVRAGRRYRWRPEGIAVSLLVLAVSLGLTLVAIGGLSGSPPLVVAGIVTGSVLLYLIVVRFRRQTWREKPARGGGRGASGSGIGHR